MYIWVLLATFITILYGFNLSVRGDIRDVRIAPMAEAVVSRIAVQHRAAQDYADIQRNSIISSDNRILQLEEAELQNFAPKGFVFEESEVYSAIYCVEKGRENTAAQCSDPNAQYFVVTYNVIPARWRNMRNNLPSQSLFSAIKTVMGKNASFGYTTEKRKDLDEPDDETYVSNLEIRNNDGMKNTDIVRVFVPEAIYKTGDFATKCGTHTICLVYMTSTSLK